MRAGDAIAQLRALPMAADIDTILHGAAPLVLAPHADDESLGCGGLLAACANAGRQAAVAVLTDGTGSHPNSAAFPPARLRAEREQEARDAVTLLGLDSSRLTFLRTPDTRAPTHGAAFEDAVRRVAEALRRFGCGVLLAPWRHDPHGDHVAAHLIAVEAALRAGVRHLAYPVWGWLRPPEDALEGPAPAGWRLPIAPFLPAKRAAIRAHASQYGGLITDDPEGFTLPPALLTQFEKPFEVFLSAP